MHRVSSLPARVTVSSIGLAIQSQHIARVHVPKASLTRLATRRLAPLTSNHRMHQVPIFQQQVRHGWVGDMWRQLWGTTVKDTAAISTKETSPEATSTIVVKSVSGKH
jgi:hypothetical protein